MATIINNPGTTESSDNGSVGLVVGLLVVVLIVIALFYFGGGYFRGSKSTGTPTTIENNVQAPQPAQGDSQGSAPQINVPDKIDVNVQGK